MATVTSESNAFETAGLSPQLVLKPSVTLVKNGSFPSQFSFDYGWFSRVITQYISFRGILPFCATSVRTFNKSCQAN